MDRRTVLIGAASLATVATTAAMSSDKKEAQMNQPAEKVLGIGGLFFRSRDPKALSKWYQQNLGIDPVPTGPGQKSWQQAAGSTAFAPFPMDSDYLGPKEQAWMINFRVRDMDAMVAQLRKANIDVKLDPEKYPIGRFARLHDPEGNPIELWEPPAAA